MTPTARSPARTTPRTLPTTYLFSFIHLENAERATLARSPLFSLPGVKGWGGSPSQTRDRRRGLLLGRQRQPAGPSPEPFLQKAPVCNQRSGVLLVDRGADLVEPLVEHLQL